LKQVEIESLIKGFLLFFLSMTTLISIIIYTNYTKDVKNLDIELLNQMRICSFDLKCKEFNINFANKDKEIYKLYKNNGTISAYFPILQSDNNLLAISLSKKNYQKKLNNIKKELLKESIPIIIITIILSIFFSFYTLSPLRKSLRVTEEFIKDILHDFNTPLASLRLNSSMLKREIGENKKITRIQSSIETILSLQENLKSYLFDYKVQQDKFELEAFIQKSVEAIEKSYPHIKYNIDIPNNIKIKTNPQAFKRVIDNLLSNASKYNKIDGKVDIKYKDNKLIIFDTGKGIKDTKQVFKRFYKEQDRGMGVGLHIVKKLCNELKIDIELESQIGIGSRFILNLAIASNSD